MRASIVLCGVTDELARLVAFAEAFAGDCGFADDERARLLIILEELFTNVVAHGNAQSVTATLGLSRGRLSPVSRDQIDHPKAGSDRNHRYPPDRRVEALCRWGAKNGRQRPLRFNSNSMPILPTNEPRLI